MEIQTPEWLTKEFIQTALEKRNDYKIEVVDFTVDMPVEKGNNYICDIFRTQIQYRKSNDPVNLNNESFIIKAPKRGPLYEYILTIGVLQKESNIYNEFSPRLKSVFGENLENDEYILPESYFSTEQNVLILEDLKVKDYKMADRVKQLDFDHCVLALKSLAKFHAASVLIYEKDPEFIKNVGHEIIFREDSHDEELGKGFTVSSFRRFFEMIKSNSKFQKYIKFFEEYNKNGWKLTVDSLKYKENEFSVLNHGDFWVGNMLFKYNYDNIPIKIKLIDFQVPRYTSPVIDFMYFIDASVQEKIRAEQFDDLILVYLNEFNSILKQHGSNKRLLLSEFEKSMKERSNFRLYLLSVLVPYAVADVKETDIVDIKELDKAEIFGTESNTMNAYYKNEKYLNLVEKRLAEFEKIGLISAE